MPLELASTSWFPEEYAVMETGQLTMGEDVRKFEEIFAKKFGVKYTVMCNSGSSANLLGVAALTFGKDGL